MKTKVSKWQILKWELRDKWQFSYVRKKIRTFWAYSKLAWALRFCKNEFSKLLNIDTEAMITMSAYGRRRYGAILSKVRSKIGDHGFAKYTLQKFFKDIFAKKHPYDEFPREKLEKLMEFHWH